MEISLRQGTVRHVDTAVLEEDVRKTKSLTRARLPFVLLSLLRYIYQQLNNWLEFGSM